MPSSPEPDGSSSRPSFPVAHHLSKALGEVRFPVTKGDLVETRGEAIVRTGAETTTSIRALLSMTTVETFETAAGLFGALMAAVRAVAPMRPAATATTRGSAAPTDASMAQRMGR